MGVDGGGWWLRGWVKRGGWEKRMCYEDGVRGCVSGW